MRGYVAFIIIIFLNNICHTINRIANEFLTLLGDGDSAQ